MRSAIKKRDFLVVAAIAILVESISIFIFSHQHASHNLSFLLLFHLPGIILVELMHIPDQKSLIVIGITGVVQLFIFLFIIWVICKKFMEEMITSHRRSLSSIAFFLSLL